MPVLNALKKTYSHKQDREWPWMTAKGRYSPYGPWDPWYRFTPLLRSNHARARSHPSMAAGTQDNRLGEFSCSGTYLG